jgi:hypothetical protein
MTQHRVPSLPAGPETVAAYLAAQASTSKASTLGRRVAAIRYTHKLADLALPTDAEGVKATMRGIRRTYGSARVRKAPAVAGKMLGMVATAPAGSTAAPDSRPAISDGDFLGFNLSTSVKLKHRSMLYGLQIFNARLSAPRIRLFLEGYLLPFGQPMKARTLDRANELN